MRSLRGTLASKTRDSIFAVFGEKNLPPINSNAKPLEISNWKKSLEVSNCYEMLFKKIDDNEKSPLVLTRIIQKVLRTKEYSNVQMAFVIVICLSILNPKYGKLKLAANAMKRRVKFYLVKFCI